MEFLVFLLLLFDALLWNGIDDCFQYQMNMTVSNLDHTSKSYAQFYITLNTFDMFDSGMIEETCSDLCISRLGSSKCLRIWIEGQCPSNSTLIWIQIDHMESEETIFLRILSGCNDSSIIDEYSNHTIWDDGYFYMLSKSTCHEDSSDFEDATDIEDESFLKIMTTYTNHIVGSFEDHTHEMSLLLFSCGPMCSTVVCDIVGGTESISERAHQHIGEMSSNCDPSPSSVPPWFGVKACRGKKYYNLKGFIVPFNDTSEISNLDGLELVKKMENRYIRISSTYDGNLGGTIYHGHSFSSNTTVTSVDVANCVAGAGVVVSRDTHSHAYAGYSGTNNTNLVDGISLVHMECTWGVDNMTYNFVELSDLNHHPSHFLSYASSVPQMGWEMVTDAEYIGKFVVGANLTTHHISYPTTPTDDGDHADDWIMTLEETSANDNFDVEVVDTGASGALTPSSHFHSTTAVSSDTSADPNDLKRTEMLLVTRKNNVGFSIVKVGDWVLRFPEVVFLCNGTVCNGTCCNNTWCNEHALDCNITEDSPCIGDDCDDDDGEEEEDDDDNGNNEDDDYLIGMSMTEFFLVFGGGGGGGSILLVCLILTCYLCLCCGACLLFVFGGVCGGCGGLAIFKIVRGSNKVSVVVVDDSEQRQPLRINTRRRDVVDSTTIDLDSDVDDCIRMEKVHLLLEEVCDKRLNKELKSNGYVEDKGNIIKLKTRENRPQEEYKVKYVIPLMGLDKNSKLKLVNECRRSNKFNRMGSKCIEPTKFGMLDNQFIVCTKKGVSLQVYLTEKKEKRSKVDLVGIMGGRMYGVSSLSELVNLLKSLSEAGRDMYEIAFEPMGGDINPLTIVCIPGKGGVVMLHFSSFSMRRAGCGKYMDPLEREYCEKADSVYMSRSMRSLYLNDENVCRAKDECTQKDDIYSVGVVMRDFCMSIPRYRRYVRTAAASSEVARTDEYDDGDDEESISGLSEEDNSNTLESVVRFIKISIDGECEFKELCEFLK